MDILLLAGLEGAFEFTFNILVPDGNSGYYNSKRTSFLALAGHLNAT